jgi:hypothetical protein
VGGTTAAGETREPVVAVVGAGAGAGTGAKGTEAGGTQASRGGSMGMPGGGEGRSVLLSLREVADSISNARSRESGAEELTDSKYELQAEEFRNRELLT